MSTPKRIGRYNGVHAHLTAVVTPMDGPRKGQQWTLRTLESIDFDQKTKYAALKGPQIQPVAVGVTDSEPEWSGEMGMVEFKELTSWMGTGWGGIQIQVDITWKVPGNRAWTDHIYGTFIGAGSISSKTGDIVKAKIGAQATAIHPRGIDPFNFDGLTSGGTAA